MLGGEARENRWQKLRHVILGHTEAHGSDLFRSHDRCLGFVAEAEKLPGISQQFLTGGVRPGRLRSPHQEFPAN